MRKPDPLDSTSFLFACQALANLADRPNRVLCNQRLMIGGYELQPRQIFFGSDISERNTDVSQKSAALDSLDR